MGFYCCFCVESVLLHCSFLCNCCGMRVFLHLLLDLHKFDGGKVQVALLVFLWCNGNFICVTMLWEESILGLRASKRMAKGRLASGSENFSIFVSQPCLILEILGFLLKYYRFLKLNWLFYGVLYVKKSRKLLPSRSR